MNRLLAVDKPPTCAGEWLMPPGSPQKRKRAMNQCLECGRFLKAYGDGWATGVHDDCERQVRSWMPKP